MKADIVVIDDTPDNLRLLVGILKQQEYAVRPFSEGVFGLNSIRETPPDLILLDIKMPGMDGFEVCKHLKADERTRDIPVIFISALGDIQDKVNGFNAGGVDYIIKPFQAEEVLARVKTHVALRNAQTGLEEKNQQLQQEISRREEAEEELRVLNHQLEDTNHQLEEANCRLEEANCRLEEANQQLQEANAGKDTFFSIIAHDLRNPFNALLSLTELLVEDIDRYSKEQLKTKLSHLHDSSEKVYALVTNLLQWSRLERGLMTYEPQTFLLIDLAERNVRLLVQNAEQKHIQINNLVPYGMGVYADYQMIDLVLRNLLSNALKFTERGGTIDVSARIHEHTVECIISDTGIGMGQETMEKLFRIDAKTSTPGTAGEEGTGLGLILCKELVEKNGGSIRVESEIGKGSRFVVLLPGREPASA